MSDSGICLQPYIPMRREPDEKSELTSQVLYGESFTILESAKKTGFSLVQLDHDQYTGWIVTRTYHLLSDEHKEFLRSQNQYVTHNPFTLLAAGNKSVSLMVGCGSTIYFRGSKVQDLTSTYQIEEKDIYSGDKDPRKALIEFGIKLLNIPYLWGGRSSFGFDCSGLCQNLYRQIGMTIPRDSGPQSGSGRIVSFPDEARPGDLAFFDNEEGKIIHVGMLIDQKRILHSSGKVRIDKIDQQGIFCEELKRYTHKLRMIRSFMDEK